MRGLDNESSWEIISTRIAGRGIRFLASRAVEKHHTENARRHTIYHVDFMHFFECVTENCCWFTMRHVTELAIQAAPIYQNLNLPLLASALA